MIPLVGEFPALVVIPEGMLAALGLIAFLGFLVSTGMLKAYAHTFGYLIRWLAQNIDVGIPTGLFGQLHPLRSVAHALGDVDNIIRNELADLADGYDQIASWAFARVAEIWDWQVKTFGDFAWDVVNSVHHTAAVTIPNALLDAEHLAARRLRGLDRGIDHLQRATESELARLGRGIDNLGAQVGRTIARDWRIVKGQVHDLEHGLNLTKARLHRIERLTAAASFAGLVAVALGRLGLKWMRCRNVTKLGKRICGMDPSILEDLLLATTLVFSSVSVVEFAKELEAASGVIIDGLTRVIREFPDGGVLELDGATFPH